MDDDMRLTDTRYDIDEVEDTDAPPTPEAPIPEPAANVTPIYAAPEPDLRILEYGYHTFGWRYLDIHPYKKTPLGPWKDREPRPLHMVMADVRFGASVGVLLTPSKLIVVDLDDEDAIDWYELMHDDAMDTVCVRTGGGGKHYYYQAPEGVDLKTINGWQGMKIDLKATGYVIAPPSRHQSGNNYAWRTPPGEIPLMPAPDWLVEQCRVVTRQPSPMPRIPTNTRVAQDGTRVAKYMAAVLSRCMDTLSSATEGARNATLNKVAFALGRFAHACDVDEAAVRAEAVSRAVNLGLKPTEADATWTSGYVAGQRHPADTSHIGRPVVALDGEQVIRLWLQVDARPMSASDMVSFLRDCGAEVQDAVEVGRAMGRLIGEVYTIDGQECVIERRRTAKSNGYTLRVTELATDCQIDCQESLSSTVEVPHPPVEVPHPPVEVPLNEKQLTVEVPHPPVEVPHPPHKLLTNTVPEHRPKILPEGLHTLPGGDRFSCREDEYCKALAYALPAGLVYTRSHIPGYLETAQSDHGITRAHWVPMDTARLALLAHEYADVIEYKRDKSTGQLTEVPLSITDTTSRRVLSLLSPGLGLSKPLQAIHRWPTFSPTWQVSSPGYNAETRIYYDGEAVDPVTDPAEIARAFEDILVDFPWHDPASPANFVALLLTPLLQPVCPTRPIFLIHASTPGTGKTLLAQIWGTILQGEPVPATTWPERQEEQEKRLISLLACDHTLVNLDNLPRRFDSKPLAAFVTSPSFAGRWLGATRMVTLAQTTTICATGNNLDLEDELIRRSVPIWLQAPDARPEQRTQFRHADLLGHVCRNRRHILGCLVGLVQRWVDAGRPAGRLRVGSFERWSGIISGILADTPWEGLLGNMREWRADRDDSTARIESLLLAWSENPALRGMDASIELLQPLCAAAHLPADTAQACSKWLSAHADTWYQVPTSDWDVVQMRFVTATKRRPRRYKLETKPAE